MAGTNIQKWGSYEVEEAEEDRKETERKGNFFKVKKPKVQLRFLPPKRGGKTFIKTWQHYTEIVPGDKRTQVIVNCPKRMKKERCPLCEMADKKFSTGSKADQERGYDLKAKLRVYAAVVDRDDEDKGVQTYPFGQTIFDALISIRDDTDFVHPVNGCDIIIRKKGSTRNDTEYMVSAARSNSPIHEDSKLMDEWFEALPDLVRNAFVPSYAEIQKTIDDAFAKSEEPDEGGDEDRGRGSRRGGGRNGRSERGERGGERAARGRASDDDDGDSYGAVGDDGRPIDTEGETVDRDDQEDLWGRDEGEGDGARG
jgi:hypothetical protein